MGRKDFLVMLGASSGLQVDYDNGTLVGKREDFVVTADVSSNVKLYVTCVRRDEPMNDADRGEAEAKISCANKVSVNNHTICFECDKLPRGKEGAIELSNMVSSVTAFLKTHFYEDRSEEYPDEIVLSGKALSTFKGDTVLSSALTSLIGVVAGGFLGFMIIYLISTSSPMIGRFLTGCVFVLLPLIGFEMMKTRKSLLNIGILLVGLLVSGCLYSRINQATDMCYTINTAAGSYTVNAMSDILEAFTGSRIEIPEVTFAECYDAVPHVWEANGDYLTNYIIVLAFTLGFFALAVFNYYRERGSIFSVFVDIYQIIFQRNR